MSWTYWVPPSKAQAKAAAVTVSCSKPSGRFRQTMRVTVRPDRIEGGLNWWIAGARVRVQIGDGQNLGILRLSPALGAEGVGLKQSGGKGQLAVLAMPGFSHLRSTAAVPQETVDFDNGDGWIEVTLPDWARPAAPAKPVPAAAQAVAVLASVEAKSAKAPWSGVGTTGHAELYAGRRPGAAVRK